MSEQYLSDTEIGRLTSDQQREYRNSDDAAKRFYASSYRDRWAKGEDTTANPPTGHTVFGWLLLIAGTALMIWGLSYNPSISVDVPSLYGTYTRTEDVVNLGKAIEKIIIFSAGGFTILCGSVFLVGANILSKIDRSRD